MFHGLSVDCIDKHRPNSDERRKAYLAGIANVLIIDMVLVLKTMKR